MSASKICDLFFGTCAYDRKMLSWKNKRNIVRKGISLIVAMEELKKEKVASLGKGEAL